MIDKTSAPIRGSIEVRFPTPLGKFWQAGRQTNQQTERWTDRVIGKFHFTSDNEGKWTFGDSDLRPDLGPNKKCAWQPKQGMVLRIGEIALSISPRCTSLGNSSPFHIYYICIRYHLSICQKIKGLFFQRAKTLDTFERCVDILIMVILSETSTMGTDYIEVLFAIDWREE